MPIKEELSTRFTDRLTWQETQDRTPTCWVAKDALTEVLTFLKTEVARPFRTLFDLFAIDERVRVHRQGQPESLFTVVYHLLSYERNEDVRVKTGLTGAPLSAASIVKLWPAADWYEREAWDMFGIRFEGHPNLTRILMPPAWEGHPLRKDHPARGTERGFDTLPDSKAWLEEAVMKFSPGRGEAEGDGETECMYLNMGPHHTGTHGVLRLVLKLDGETIEEIMPDIGFHHRAAEKTGERQTWHTFVPYTDRVDYLAGFLNELPYVLAVETLADIEVPQRVMVTRVMLSELFRIINHLVYFGTFVQDLGAISPVFYTFNDRERLFCIVEAIAGGRMHPMWFRVGGLAQDLPVGWEELVRAFIRHFPPRLREWEKVVVKNRIFIARTRGVGKITADDAIEWGVTGPNLRACGIPWDLRKTRPYSGYESLDFEVPTATDGDCFSRAVLRIEEMRQSLRIVEQCMREMPPGTYKSSNRLASPPLKGRTMHDIETLIHHFISVSWGMAMPPGEAGSMCESAKGSCCYYLVSDGNTVSYRTRIRTPSFPHIQAVPRWSRGSMLPDLVALLGSIDYVMGDVDR